MEKYLLKHVSYSVYNYACWYVNPITYFIRFWHNRIYNNSYHVDVHFRLSCALVFSHIVYNHTVVFWSYQKVTAIYREFWEGFDPDSDEFCETFNEVLHAQVLVLIQDAWDQVKAFKLGLFVDFLVNLFTSQLVYLTALKYTLYSKAYNRFSKLKLTNILLFDTNYLFYNTLNNRTIWLFFKKSRLPYYTFSTFYKGCKTLLLPIFISALLCIILIDYYNINFIRQIASWAVVGLIFFWLMSGFNFFLKRYRFGKFTSAIQRFWKRTNAYFWLIEGFLFCLFFYYYLNSSQEVFYFFDESNLNQTGLTSLSSFYASSIVLFFLIFYSLFLMLNLSNFVYKQQILHLKIITILFVYIFLIECYQFYYVITLFFEMTWDFDGLSNVWSLDWRTPKIRVRNQYFVLALIAKYWHFLFIFFSWLFLILKSFEQKRLHYTLFGVNVQNCILLFLLNLLFNIYWLKWLFRRYYDVVYYWFFVDINNWSFLNLTTEFFNFFSNF